MSLVLGESRGRGWDTVSTGAKSIGRGTGVGILARPMPAASFLLQGFKAETHREALTWVLACPRIQTAILGVAYVRRSGVTLVDTALRAVAAKANLFVGIRNDVTSAQGIDRLLTLGARVFAVDTGSASVLFHPKVYFARGMDEARLVVGSPNLTARGLNANIEASLCLTLALPEPEDRAIAAGVENAFMALPQSHPDHVVKLGAADVSNLLTQGRLVDENVRWRERALTNPDPNAGDALPRIQLRTTVQTGIVLPPTKRAQPLPPGSMELMWRSKPLVERDLNIPSTAGTHATGSINLDKGLLDPGTDHRHYFRNVVFSALAWQPSPVGPVEIATARCRLLVKKVDRGEFRTVIAHTTSTTTTSYLQRNVMTRLRWGPMAVYVGRRELLGRTLQLFRASDDPECFVIEID